MPGDPLQPQPGSAQRCQHCERDIYWHKSGRWIDSDGVWVCFRGADAITIAHTPIPDIPARTT